MPQHTHKSVNSLEVYAARTGTGILAYVLVLLLLANLGVI